MKYCKEDLPETPSDESKKHSWIWSCSHAYVLVPLMVIGSILNILSIAVDPLYTSKDLLKLFFLILSMYFLVWICVLLPAICVRICCKQRLNWFISILLTIIGLVFANTVMYSIFGSGFRGGIMLVFLLGSAYKVSRSYFGLYSIGIPIPFRSNLPLERTKTKKVDSSINTHMSSCLPLKDIGEVRSREICALKRCDIEQSTIPSIGITNLTDDGLNVEAESSIIKNINEKTTSKRIVSAFCYGVLLVLFIVYGAIRHSQQWDEDTLLTSFGVPLMCVLVPWWCGDFARDNLAKVIACYKDDKPAQSIAYAIIGMVFIGCWYYSIYGLICILDNEWKNYIDDYLHLLPIPLQIISYIIISKLKASK